MSVPAGMGIIDTMMGTRAGQIAKEQNYAPLRQGQLKDADSQQMNFPAQYMFKDVPWSDQARGAGDHDVHDRDSYNSRSTLPTSLVMNDTRGATAHSSS